MLLPTLSRKLHDRLGPSGWGDLLKAFTLSDDFTQIIRNLETEVADKHRFTPPLRQALSAFERCPLERVQVVLVAPGPYATLHVADGMAFSCNPSAGRTEPALRVLREAAGSGPWKPEMSALGDWAAQGVLLLNQALTTRVGRPNRHLALWAGFTTFLVDTLSARRPDLIWVLVGPEPAQLADMLHNSYVTWQIPLPETAHLQHASWPGRDVFSQINAALAAQNKPPVVW
jgi:uracil-DNA glycosylase